MVYWQSTDSDKQEGCKSVARQFFGGAVLHLLPISLRLELISTQSSGFKKEGMRFCTGEGWIAKILG